MSYNLPRTSSQELQPPKNFFSRVIASHELLSRSYALSSVLHASKAERENKNTAYDIHIK